MVQFNIIFLHNESNKQEYQRFNNKLLNLPKNIEFTTNLQIHYDIFLSKNNYNSKYMILKNIKTQLYKSNTTMSTQASHVVCACNLVQHSLGFTSFFSYSSQLVI
jgi:hypothetical protein